MKHLPNLLTIGNLICGCIAVVFILNSQPYLAGVNGAEYWVNGVEQMLWGTCFILLAAVFDLLDGWVARALSLYSPIGPDLDSLADVVSFGVAPSMILYKMLWGAYMLEPYAMDVSMWAMLPAFLIAAAAAIRLARFNVHSTSSFSFKGLPTPAAGLFIAGLPLINWFNPLDMGVVLQNKWVLMAIIIIVSWLMVSKIKFMKLMPASLSIAQAWPQILLVVLSLISFFVLKFAAIPIIFALYIVLSFFAKDKTLAISDEQ